MTPIKQPEIIEFSIDGSGAVEVQTKGFKGSSCKAATQGIFQALGQVTSDRNTPEFFQSQGVQNRAVR